MSTRAYINYSTVHARLCISQLKFYISFFSIQKVSFCKLTEKLEEKKSLEQNKSLLKVRLKCGFRC